MDQAAAKCKVPEEVAGLHLSLRAVDSYGKWTALWESQFTALNIPHLRSHTLVHTDALKKVRTLFAFSYEATRRHFSFAPQLE